MILLKNFLIKLKFSIELISLQLFWNSAPSLHRWSNQLEIAIHSRFADAFERVERLRRIVETHNILLWNDHQMVYLHRKTPFIYSKSECFIYIRCSFEYFSYLNVAHRFISFDIHIFFQKSSIWILEYYQTFYVKGLKCWNEKQISMSYRKIKRERIEKPPKVHFGNLFFQVANKYEYTMFWDRNKFEEFLAMFT